MKREQEEKIFVQKILDGNPRAQEEFYNEYKKIIKKFIKTKKIIPEKIDKLKTKR